MANVIANTQEQTDTRTTWTLDPSHTSVQFSAKHMMVTTVRGHFGPVSGAIQLDEKDFANSEVEVLIDVAGISSRDERRDGHLRSGDFFDVENFPSAAFKSKRIERTGDETFKVTGDLTVRGVTREVTLDTQFEGFTTSPWGQQVVAFTASTTINRKEFGLNWNVVLETGGMLVGEKIKLEIDVEAIKQ